MITIPIGFSVGKNLNLLQSTLVLMKRIAVDFGIRALLLSWTVNLGPLLLFPHMSFHPPAGKCSNHKPPPHPRPKLPSPLPNNNTNRSCSAIQGPLSTKSKALVRSNINKTDHSSGPTSASASNTIQLGVNVEPCSL